MCDFTGCKNVIMFIIYLGKLLKYISAIVLVPLLKKLKYMEGVAR